MTARETVLNRGMRVLYFRSLSVDDVANTDALEELYRAGWRVVAMATDNGVPHFVLERQSAVAI
jgi:hypothetical protein